jgi:hypothetical protein
VVYLAHYRHLSSPQAAGFDEKVLSHQSIETLCNTDHPLRERMQEIWKLTHLSAAPKVAMPRKPRVGETIVYQVELSYDGKHVYSRHTQGSTIAHEVFGSENLLKASCTTYCTIPTY